MLIAGIDENGLGPKLGPLIVTIALFRADDENSIVDRVRLEGLKGCRRPIDDSKRVMSFGAMASGEQKILSIGSSILNRHVETCRDFVSEFTFSDGPNPENCPARGKEMCFGYESKLPLFSDRIGSDRPGPD